jgi:hypothetical protein
VLLARELLDDALIELPSLRRESDHAVLRKPPVDTFERCRDHVDAEHHARAAAVRLVVDLAARERRPVAIVEEPKVELAPEDRGDGSLLGHGCKDMGHEREDIDPQSPGRLVIRAHRDYCREMRLGGQ